MTAPTSLKELTQPYVDANPATETLGLLFGETRIDVHSNSAELIAKLKDYFRDFLGTSGEAEISLTAIEHAPINLDDAVDFTIKQPDPGKSKIKEAWYDYPDGRVVKKVITGMHFMLGGGFNVAVGPCIENDNQVVNFINNRFIEKLIKEGCQLFHAAGVAVGDAGLLMAGFSGMGKSTLALHVMPHGTDFVSNDRAMVRREDGQLMMYGVAKMPRVNPGTVLYNEHLKPVIPADERAQFEAMPQSELWDLEHKYDAFIDECFGPGKFKLRTRMEALVLLNWERTDAPLAINQIDLRERPELMPAFTKSVGLFFEMDEVAKSLDFSDEAYIELLGDCPVYELTGGTRFEDAAKFCADFLKEKSS